MDYFDMLEDGPEGKTGVIVLHDKPYMSLELGNKLAEKGFYTHAYSSGKDFLSDWNKSPKRFDGTNTIMIHKDIGDTTSMPVLDIINEFRLSPEGNSLRVIVVSGEFTYKGVSKEACEKYFADGGYDPTGIERTLPKWVVDFIKLGKVSEKEADSFRGVEIVHNEDMALRRRFWKEHENQETGSELSRK